MARSPGLCFGVVDFQRKQPRLVFWVKRVPGRRHEESDRPVLLYGLGNDVLANLDWGLIDLPLKISSTAS